MTGPCLCGDPYCQSCGNPYASELEAAEEWTMETLAKESLTAEEYKIVVHVGLEAVRQARLAVQEVTWQIATAAAEKETTND